MLRALLERRLRTRWTGPAVRIRFWDGRETTVGVPPTVATVTLHDQGVLREFARSPSLGFGHAYQDDRLTVDGDLQALLQASLKLGSGRRWNIFHFPLSIFNSPRIDPRQSAANARFHYDIGNAFFKLWLDPSLTYSCAYFRNENDSLEQAQRNKLELICRKLELDAGQTLLDVGCGWGSLLFHAIEKYGVRGHGVTPSREQAAYIEQEATRRGIADALTLRVADWRSITGHYDRVASVGMFEHVGKAHGAEFLRKWKEWLKPGGVSLLHTIGTMRPGPVDPWLVENIFPGGYLPGITELTQHAADAQLLLTDVDNLYRHYALTLAAWSKAFAEKKEQILRVLTADGARLPRQHPDQSATPAGALAKAERLYRTWWLYLQTSEATFRAGRVVLWQLVLTNGKRPHHPLTREGWDLRQSSAG